MEDNQFFYGRVAGRGNGSGGNASDGEWQIAAHLRLCGPVPKAQGLGTPGLNGQIGFVSKHNPHCPFSKVS